MYDVLAVGCCLLLVVFDWCLSCVVSTMVCVVWCLTCLVCYMLLVVCWLVLVVCMCWSLNADGVLIVVCWLLRVVRGPSLLVCLLLCCNVLFVV